MRLTEIRALESFNSLAMPFNLSVVTRMAALLRIGKKALKNHVMWGVSALAFIGIFFFSVPFPAIILGAGLVGWIGGRRWPQYFSIRSSHSGAAAAGDNGFVISDTISEKIGTPTLGRSLRFAVLWSAIWLAPVLLCLLVLVLQFVGFLGGFNSAAEMSPLLVATLGALSGYHG